MAKRGRKPKNATVATKVDHAKLLKQFEQEQRVQLENFYKDLAKIKLEKCPRCKCLFKFGENPSTYSNLRASIFNSLSKSVLSISIIPDSNSMLKICFSIILNY